MGFRYLGKLYLGCNPLRDRVMSYSHGLLDRTARLVGVFPLVLGVAEPGAASILSTRCIKVVLRCQMYNDTLPSVFDQ
jgi:hypothetical protein